jgi:peroxiredoxin
MIELNQPVPDFALPDLAGGMYRLSAVRGRIVIVNFWSAECPHSERTDRLLLEDCVRWGEEVIWLTVAANRNESAELVRKVAETRHLPRVLLDAECRVADLFGAQTTPHVFVSDRQGILRYRGAVDNVAFRQRQPTQFYLRQVVEALLAGQLPQLAETPAFGCALVREI